MTFSSFVQTFLDGLAPMIPIVVIAIKYPTLPHVGIRWILLFFIACFAGYAFAATIGVCGFNNLWLYNWLPLIFSVPLFFYFKILHKGQIAIITNIVLAAGCILLYAFNPQHLWKPNAFASLLYIYFACFIIVNAACFYIEEFQFMNSIPIWEKNAFWFVSSLLIYAGFSAFIWASFGVMMDRAIALKLTEDQLKYIGDLWKLHNFIFAISCILYTSYLLWKK